MNTTDDQEQPLGEYPGMSFHEQRKRDLAAEPYFEVTCDVRGFKPDTRRQLDEIAAEFGIARPRELQLDWLKVAVWTTSALIAIAWLATLAWFALDTIQAAVR